MTAAGVTTGAEDPPDATAMLAVAGLGAARGARRLAGGANNRVWRIDAAHGVAVLKEYFRHPDDPRDRLGAEFAFSRFAWEAGLRRLPEPLADDPARALGLYAFVPGVPPPPAAIDAAHVRAAAGFVRDVNRHRDAPAAAALPAAAEACFSIADHLARIDRRVERLRDAPAAAAGTRTGGPPDGPAAAAAVVPRIVAAWQHVRPAILRASADHADPRRPLDRAALRISPSDFGFHNCLVRPDGELVFLDFEYAGWDDPAKLVCDFFCQPEVPAPRAALDAFAALVADGADATLGPRVAALLPGYDVKWCCILLESCLPVGRARRRFAGIEADDAHVAAQLEKVRAILDRLGS